MTKLYFKKNSGNYIGIVCIMLLFGMFTILSLALLLVGQNSYKKIKNQAERTFNSGALVSYLENKIRNHNGDKISIDNSKEVDMLILNDDSGKYQTYIYCNNGKIYENIVIDGKSPEVGIGEAVYTAKSVDFEKVNDHLIKIKVLTQNSDRITTFVAINTGLN